MLQIVLEDAQEYTVITAQSPFGAGVHTVVPASQPVG